MLLVDPLRAKRPLVEEDAPAQLYAAFKSPKSSALPVVDIVM
jgi:hypothetical protein